MSDPYRNDQEAQLHVIEGLRKENLDLAAEAQGLRDENARLRKGDLSTVAAPDLESFTKMHEEMLKARRSLRFQLMMSVLLIVFIQWFAREMRW